MYDDVRLQTGHISGIKQNRNIAAATKKTSGVSRTPEVYRLITRGRRVGRPAWRSLLRSSPRSGQCLVQAGIERRPTRRQLRQRGPGWAAADDALNSAWKSTGSWPTQPARLPWRRPPLTRQISMEVRSGREGRARRNQPQMSRRRPHEQPSDWIRMAIAPLTGVHEHWSGWIRVARAPLTGYLARWSGWIRGANRH